MVVTKELPRLISIQVSGTNENIVPLSIELEEPKEVEQTQQRPPAIPGVMLISNTERCSLEGFMAALAAEGYELAEAKHRTRPNVKDRTGKTKIHIMRYVFCESQHIDINEGFRRRRDQILAEFRTINEGSMWTVKGYLNPFFQNGKAVEGEHALDISFIARTPLFQTDGQPVIVHGKPLKADHCLRIEEGAVTLS